MPEQVVSKRRDVEELDRALHPWLAQRFPGRQLEDLDVAAPSGHGFSNDTIMVEATVDATNVPLVVQAAPRGPGLFPEYPIDRMAAIQRDLRDHSDVPVANVRWFEADTSVLGAPFYVMDRIDGLVPDESPCPITRPVGCSTPPWNSGGGCGCRISRRWADCTASRWPPTSPI